MSGYIKDETVEREALASDSKFLPKPFTADALGHAVRTALDSEASDYRRQADSLT